MLYPLELNSSKLNRSATELNRIQLFHFPIEPRLNNFAPDISKTVSNQL